jgi:uncharacterized glyoxalase superfamily protein PhnB
MGEVAAPSVRCPTHARRYAQFAIGNQQLCHSSPSRRQLFSSGARTGNRSIHLFDSRVSRPFPAICQRGAAAFSARRNPLLLTKGSRIRHFAIHGRTLMNMPTHFPQAVPEIPVSSVEQAAAYYVQALGFHLDWHSHEDGIAGISQDQCRMFLTDAPFRQRHGNGAPVVVWLNLDSRQEVDQLYTRWQQAGARILAEPEDKPWNLREFTAADLDGNQLRVFYDFTRESQ